IGSGFNDNSIVLAEGATGVGKSYGYLIPSFKWVSQNNERIVISTATIALQEQLLKKDVPMVAKLLNLKHIKVVLAKGRANYLCLRRFKDVLIEEALFVTDDSELAGLELWYKGSKTGDKSELNFTVPGDLWAKINSESDNCLAARCPNYSDCFVYKMRKEAHQAKIIITNHHLLFADMVMRSEGEGELAILPNYSKIIFDEAHNIERSATEFFSAGFNRYSLTKQLLRLHRRKGGRALGVLTNFEQDGDKKLLDKIYRLYDEVQLKLDKLNVAGSRHLEDNFRLKHLTGQLEQGVVIPMQELGSALTELCYSLERLSSAGTNEAAVLELKLATARLAGIAAICERFTHYNEEQTIVFWGERNNTSFGESYYRYLATPLDIGGQMQEIVYQKYSSVAMLSATLAVGDDFSYFKKRLGLYNYTAREVAEQSFASPFNYGAQALLAIASDSYDPQAQQQDYLNYTVNFLLNLFTATQGRGLVLFTSYKLLRDVAAAIQNDLEAAGILLLCQGDADRGKLIKQFETSGKAVLLGTDSFWEGVDIDNIALKTVIICRLPFYPPTAPLAEAKAEHLERQGLRAFNELQLPEAAIKLKQGFGRLIRKGGDYGAVFIIDKRVLTKNYGSNLLNALPKAKRLYGEGDKLISEVKKFLNDKE
ncbi:MAG: hypothetical protein FWE37_09125, partial [Spirochaetaceae bacterium]|nr:hypothetical protein [Spirochaetaceae bacterium]